MLLIVVIISAVVLLLKTSLGPITVHGTCHDNKINVSTQADVSTQKREAPFASMAEI